jgi:hypothetical protein
VAKYVFLPVILKSATPPAPPTINLIENNDRDNIYTVSWAANENTNSYKLEEANIADFSVTSVVYQGSALSWASISGKMPGTYYYRLSGSNSFGTSNWSSVQSITIYPLYVGLKIRWDGNGYIRGSNNYDVGTHLTIVINSLIDEDTIKLEWISWYLPDPKNWGASSWVSYYSPTTGVFKSSNTIDDPSWKWGASFKLSYNSQFQSGATVSIGGQKFTVTGPFDSYTTYGKPIKYWQFVNQEKFLIWDGGSDWTQYVHPGDITLRFDAGGSALKIYENIIRRGYYKGTIEADTVQYIEQLSSATSLLGSPPFVPNTSVIGATSQDQIKNNFKAKMQQSTLLK